jgi:hypothetical protein
MEAWTWKKIIWIGIAILVGAGIVTGAVCIVQSWRAPETSQAVLCEGKTLFERDDCLWSLAREQEDAEWCKEITEEATQGSCTDEIHQRLAIKFQDADHCWEMQDREKAEVCARTIEERQVTEENCEAYFSQEICVDRLTIERAVAAKNPDICAEVTDVSLLEDCIESVGIADRDLDGLDEAREKEMGSSDTDKDSDDDGLEDAEEVFEYKTNPVVADTDKDGYTDGQEVQSGYNPLGAGRL